MFILAAVGSLHVSLAREQLVYGHVWPQEDSEYLSSHDSFDHQKDFGLRQLLSTYWSEDRPDPGKIVDRVPLSGMWHNFKSILTFSWAKKSLHFCPNRLDTDGSESHVSSKSEFYQPGIFLLL